MCTNIGLWLISNDWSPTGSPTAPKAQVWTPVDFLDLGSRDAVDKTLQRLVHGGQLRRIDRGLYDAPRLNRLTKRPAVTDYRQIIDALARRDQVRMLVDGLTAANDLGLTDRSAGTSCDPHRRAPPFDHARQSDDRLQAHGPEQAVLGRTAGDADRAGPALAQGHVAV